MSSRKRKLRSAIPLHLIIGLFILGITIQSTWCATSVLPLKHRAYEFLERLYTRGLCSSVFISTKPLTRLEAAKAVAEIADSEERVKSLSIVEQEELEFLVKEFVEELSELIPGNALVESARMPRLGWWWKPETFPGLFYNNDRNLLSVETPQYAIFLDPIFSLDSNLSWTDSTGQTERVLVRSSGFTFYGYAGPHVGFDFDTRDSREWSNRDYPIQQGIIRDGYGWVHGKGSYLDYDETTAHITLTLNQFILQYGKGKNIWGHGTEGVLSLSGVPTSYDMIRLSTSFFTLRFTHIIGFLRQIPPIPVRVYYDAAGDSVSQVDEKKYLAAHRLDFRLLSSLNIGIYETVIFGGRFEPAYLNPVMFLKSAEHYFGGPDNAALGMDARLRIRHGTDLYGDLFIDDISTAKLGTGWQGNKVGFQCGAYCVNPLVFQNCDVRFQYTRLEPYVYSHRIPVNVYQHYGTILGHPIGPNSDEVLIAVNTRPTRRLTGRFLTKFLRHGANPTEKNADSTSSILLRNVGGDVNIPFRKGDDEKAHFLDGVIEKRLFLDLLVRYEFFRNAFVTFGGTYERYKGIQNATDGENKMLYLSIGLNE